MALVPPQYTIGNQQPGGSQVYTLNGGHLGFSEGQTGTGSVWPVVQAMNAHLGDNWEALNIGLPNDMSDPAASGKVLDQLSGCPLFIVFFAPLVPNDKSATGGSISRGLGTPDLGLGYGSAYGSGAYDTKIAQTAVSLNARGFGPKCSLRITEYNGGNFPWSSLYVDPNTHQQNGMANVHTMQQRYLNIMRTPSLVPGFAGATGFTGFFDFNGGTHTPSLNTPAAWDPQVVDTIPNRVILGMDTYAAINNPIATGGIGKDDLTTTWAAVEVQLDKILAYCRLKGYLFGIGEFGMVYNCGSAYSTNDGGYFLQKLQQKCAANADVVAYACLYNETVPPENDGFFYEGGVTGVDDSLLGTGPSPVGGTAATYKSASNTALSWVDTPSKNKQLALAAYKTWWNAGSMQYTAPPAPPPPATTIAAVPLGARLRRRGWIKA